MKKLMTALFALSAMTAFANTNPDTATTTVNVSASIKAQSQLIISKDSGVKEGESSVASIDVIHGEINKTNTSAITNLEKSSDPHFIKRVGGDDLLFNAGQNNIIISLEKSIELEGSKGNIDRLTANLEVIRGVQTDKNLPFTIKSVIDSGDVLAAKSDTYAKQTTLTVTIGATTPALETR